MIYINEIFLCNKQSTLTRYSSMKFLRIIVSSTIMLTIITSVYSESNATNTVPAVKEEIAIKSPPTWSDGLKVGGLIRIRPEMKYNYDFNSTTNDNVDFTGQKVQFFIEKEFTKDIHTKITFQDSRIWGGEKGSITGVSTANDSTKQSTDVREAWLEAKNLFDVPISLQAGRQILNYGDQRLVGGLEWSNVGRSYDGARFKFDEKYLSSHIWAMSVGEKSSDAGGNNTALGTKNQYGAIYNCPPNAKTACTGPTPDAPAQEMGDSVFTGFYNTIKPSEYFHIDLYYLGLQKKYLNTNQALALTSPNPGTPESRAGRTDIVHTYGFRLTNKTQANSKSLQAFDYALEYATQNGTNGKTIKPGWDSLNQQVDSIDPLTGNTYKTNIYREKVRYDSHAAAVLAGYTFNKLVRLGAGYEMGSGDPNRSDGSISTFQNLFSTNHGIYGIADQVGWVNMIAKSINLTLFMEKFGIFRMDYYIVNKHKRQDAWYDVTGSIKSGASTESENNNRYDMTGVYTDLGAGNKRPSAYLGRSLFREIDLKYSIPYKSINWELGYSIVYGGDAIRNKVNDNTVGSPNALIDKFSKNAQFAYLMMTYAF